MAETLKPRWGQPATGIISNIVFFLVALLTWYIFSDETRGLVKAFPYPFVLYLAMMILVGLWQHMFFGDWPFQNLSPPIRGLVQTVMNLIISWIVIHIVFYRILGLGFNFLSQSNLEAIVALGPVKGVSALELKTLVAPAGKFAERAVVTFVLIGFFSYPFVTILFAKWPIRPSDLTQPQAGFAELGWCSLLTLFFYVVLIVPFWGWLWETVFGTGIAMGKPWWTASVGTHHVHWVFGWWEWMIIVLFMTPNVWRMKPWTLIKLPQPWKGVISFVCVFVLGYALGSLCVKLIPAWVNMDDVISHLPAGDKGSPIRFLWYHAAEIAGFTLVPFLAWHHYFDDMVPMQDKDSWAAFWFRTVGVLVLAIITYFIYYVINFGFWGLGIHHMHGDLAERYINGESLIWNFWYIIPLLWNEWFFHKWPFYVHEDH
jgi:AAT family amino acid transporter